MNNEIYTKSLIPIAQLNHLLEEDAECVRMLHRLLERLHLLNMENIGPDLVPTALKVGSEMPLPETQELLSALLGAVPLIHQAFKLAEDKRDRATDLIARHDEYVLALEARAAELIEELKNRGADVSEYAPIPKP